MANSSAIGTYAAAGAKLGPAFLWTAPITFPMMFVVVYLSAKLTPPLMLLIMFMTNNPAVMGNRVNSRIINVLGRSFLKSLKRLVWLFYIRKRLPMVKEQLTADRKKSNFTKLVSRKQNRER